jgi:hypothetical protein
MARNRGLARLAPVALFMVVVTGCTSAGPASGKGNVDDVHNTVGSKARQYNARSTGDAVVRASCP